MLARYGLTGPADDSLSRAQLAFFARSMYCVLFRAPAFALPSDVCLNITWCVLCTYCTRCLVVLAGAQENRFPFCVDAIGGCGGVRGEGRQQHRLSKLVPDADPRVSTHEEILVGA